MLPLNCLSEIKNGNERAFTIAYKMFHEKVYYYLKKKTNSESAAIDLVQTTFIKLWNSKHTLKINHSLDKQIFIIARSCLIDYYRAKANDINKYIALQEINEAESNMFINSDSTFENSDYFKIAVDTLPPSRKKVFLLSRVNGLTNKEIAATLTISISTVEDHIIKALRHIRTLISILTVLFAIN
ncbi:MAG: sigma-70 family RNA polymerase sigma factor [Sediminibacterium sp.]|nr:sigma-70 family RNA polymerase sigma factor [Sediminibacterium sp.]